jgi:hypothetical protein
MPTISTWEELLASDLQLNGADVCFSTVYKQFAIIVNHEDGLLRLDWGLMVLSVIHPVKDPIIHDAELMLIVTEAPLVLAPGEAPFAPKPYVPTGNIAPHYRTADNLGLVGNHHDLSVHSVLVPIDKLDQISFTDSPAQLKQWELDILSNT